MVASLYASVKDFQRKFLWEARHLVATTILFLVLLKYNEKVSKHKFKQ